MTVIRTTKVDTGDAVEVFDGHGNRLKVVVGDYGDARCLTLIFIDEDDAFNLPGDFNETTREESA